MGLRVCVCETSLSLADTQTLCHIIKVVLFATEDNMVSKTGQSDMGSQLPIDNLMKPTVSSSVQPNVQFYPIQCPVLSHPSQLQAPTMPANRSKQRLGSLANENLSILTPR